jgi:hypothetical protein
MAYNKKSYTVPYPNPVSDALNLSFNPELVAETRASLQASGSTHRTFSLSIKLFDLFGVIQHQTVSSGDNILTIDVSGLKNGMYVLQVHDGITAAPEVHRIIVQR